MATGKKSFILYCDLIHTINKLSDEHWELFKHILKYVNDEDPKTENAIIDIVFEPIKQSLKRDLKKFEKRAERSRENGLKGGRPPREENPEKPSGLNKNPEEPRKPDSDNDSVSDSDSVSNKLDFIKLLDYINQSFGRKFKTINKNTKSKFNARLREGYKNIDIQTAILNCKESKFHKGNELSILHPEYFSRSDTLDKFSYTPKVNTEPKLTPYG